MDLFRKFGLYVLPWEENIKIFHEEENQENIIKEGLLQDNENVLLLNIKGFEELSSDNWLRVFNFLNNQKMNFLKLRYVLVNKEGNMFFTYEKAGILLTEFLSKNELSVEKRLFIFKQAIEVVYTLIHYGEKFEHFDQKFFYVEEFTNSLTKRIPILKIIYHGNFFNASRFKKNNQLVSSNFYYWIFYLLFIIFKDYNRPLSESNSVENVISAGQYFDNLNLLLRVLSEKISGRKDEELTIEEIIVFYNIILREAKMEEINVNLNNTLVIKNEANFLNYFANDKETIYNNFQNENFHYAPKNLSIPQLKLFNKPNYNSNLRDIPSGNNSQINYHQYIQFFNSNIGNLNLSNFGNGYRYPIDYHNLNYMQNSNMNNFAFNINNIPGAIQNTNFHNYFDNNHQYFLTHPNNRVDPYFNFLENKNPNYFDNKHVSNHESFSEYAQKIEALNSKNTKFSNLNKPENNLPLLNTSEELGFNLNNSNKFYQKDKTNKKESTNLMKNKRHFSIDSMFNDKTNPSCHTTSVNNIFVSVKEEKSALIVVETNCKPQSFNIIINKNILKNYMSLDFLKREPTLSVMVEKDSKSPSKSLSICSVEGKKINSGEKIPNYQKDSPYSDIKSFECKSEMSKKKRQRTNCNKPTNFVDIIEPGYRSTLTYNNIDEKDLEMINNIDYPRRKKLKERANDRNFFSSEKSHLLKSTLAKFFPMYEEELNKISEYKDHNFMKNNFPQMYNIENFYLHIKLNQERKEAKTGSLIIQSKETNQNEKEREDNLNKKDETKNKIKVIPIENLGNIKESNDIMLNTEADNLHNSNKCKKIWDCNKLDNVEVDNFLFNIEKIWPLERFVWSQETALQFLLNCDYNIDLTIKKVSSDSADFISFLAGKRLSRDLVTENHFDMNTIGSIKTSKRIRYKKLRRVHFQA